MISAPVSSIRRPLALLVIAALALPFLSLLSATDATWVVVGRDDPRASWREFWTLDGETAKVERTATGFEFRAGPQRGEDADHAVLWTRASYAGDLKLTFNYTRTDDAERDVNILYLHAQGTGEGPYAKDLAQWAALRRVPAMRVYFQHTRAWHLSYAAFVNTGPVGQPDYIRVRRYPVTPERTFAETEVPPTIESTGLFKTGVTYAVTVIKTSTALQLQVQGGGQDRSFSWDLSRFDGPNEGRIGLRHMHTRAARYDAFTIHQRRSDSSSNTKSVTPPPR
jgi:hypothetical protein